MALSKPYEDDDKEDLPPLPIVKQGEVFAAQCAVVSNKTQPPGRYTEASLVKKLEAYEIGRPSTYASILKNIKMRDYVLINKKRQLEPTPKGDNLLAMLASAKFSFMDYDWTRRIEKRLDAIAHGKDTFRLSIGEIFSVLSEEIGRLPDNSGRQVLSTLPCPCDQKGTIEVSEKAYKCTKCQSVIWKTVAGRIISQEESEALLQGQTLQLSGFTSKSGNPFDAGLCLENNKLTFKFDSEPPAASAQNTDMQCQCKGTIVDHGKKWQCESCKATVWKSLSGRAVEQNEAAILFGGGSVEMTGLTAKSGNSFSAIVVLTNGKTEFKFS
jgi:DNA topoisomerase-1